MPASLPVRVGAIRWDAWHGDRGAPGKAVQQALAPQRYHFRLPFFAKVRGDGDVTIDGIDQAIMDREIEYAVRAGLDHWAFLVYKQDSEMSLALDLYLKSNLRSKLKFCIISEANRWRDRDYQSRVLRLMREPGYVTTPDGRPVLYLGFFGGGDIIKTWEAYGGIDKALTQFRARAKEENNHDPCVIVMAFDAAMAARTAKELKLDAVTTYAVTGSGGEQPYSKLAQQARKYWDTAAAGPGVVPTITTGWDRRPRIEHPMPWEKWQKPHAGIENHYAQPTPKELEHHVREALDWIDAHPKATSLRLAIIYAWNENDEGGWLTPTLKPDGTFDQSRIEAVGRAIRGDR